MNELVGNGPEPPPDWSPSFLTPFHQIDACTNVRVVRRVHGTNSEISGTAAYKYGMDVVFTVHCELCRADIDDTGAIGGWGNPIRRVQYARADPGAWWREVLRVVKRHRACAAHTHSLAMRPYLDNGRWT